MLVPVIVYDKDAVATDRSTWPKILLQSVNGVKSLAGLTTVNRDESLGAGQYRIYLQIDAREAELSDSIDNFKVSMVASSRFGKQGQPRELSMDIYTSFATPNSTWTDTLTVKETEAVTYKFLVNDPKLEAWLSLDRIFSLPDGASLVCQATGRGMLSCTFAWTPAEGKAGSYPISVYVKSRNSDIRDTMQSTKTLYFNVQVLPKGS
jgi:hypothetical protein